MTYLGPIVQWCLRKELVGKRDEARLKVEGECGGFLRGGCGLCRLWTEVIQNPSFVLGSVKIEGQGVLFGLPEAKVFDKRTWIFVDLLLLSSFKLRPYTVTPESKKNDLEKNQLRQPQYLSANNFAHPVM